MCCFINPVWCKKKNAIKMCERSVNTQYIGGQVHLCHSLRLYLKNTCLRWEGDVCMPNIAWNVVESFGIIPVFGVFWWLDTVMVLREPSPIERKNDSIIRIISSRHSWLVVNLLHATCRAVKQFWVWIVVKDSCCLDVTGASWTLYVCSVGLSTERLQLPSPRSKLPIFESF